MALSGKRYFTLREIARRWDLEMDDLAYMAENGSMRVSVRLFSAPLEVGEYERDWQVGRTFRIPSEQTRFSGLQDLIERDASEVFRNGNVRVEHFQVEGDGYAALIEPTVSLPFRLEQVLVRRRERDRIEAIDGRPGATIRSDATFQHFDGYRTIRFGNLKLLLGPIQADVVKRLHQAVLTDDPWCSGKAVLAEAGATSRRMSDIFKSQPRWRELIESDRRGLYRLQLKIR